MQGKPSVNLQWLETPRAMRKTPRMGSSPSEHVQSIVLEAFAWYWNSQLTSNSINLAKPN